MVGVQLERDVIEMTNKFSPGRCCGCNNFSCEDCSDQANNITMRLSDYDVVYYNPVYHNFPTVPSLIDKVPLNICTIFNANSLTLVNQGSSNIGFVQFPYRNYSSDIGETINVSGYLVYHDNKACYWKSASTSYTNSPYQGLSIVDDRYVDTENPYKDAGLFNNPSIASSFILEAAFLITKNPRIYKFTTSPTNQIILGDLVFNGTGNYRMGTLNFFGNVNLFNANLFGGLSQVSYQSRIIHNMLFTPQLMDDNTCCQSYNYSTLDTSSFSKAFITQFGFVTFALTFGANESLISEQTIFSRMEMGCE